MGNLPAEARALQKIDNYLISVGWLVQSFDERTFLQALA